MKKILQIADPYQVTLNDISKLEQASNTKFNIYEKVLLVNNGTYGTSTSGFIKYFH